MSANSETFEALLRATRPGVLARLERRFSSLELAEDSLQEACLRAIVQWQETGEPDNAAAWLYKVASNLCIDGIRKSNTVSDYQLSQNICNNSTEEVVEERHYKDDVLRLLHYCCHPQLSGQDQIALALKIVCGLSVSSIARALLIQQKTMEKRITRAKQKASELSEVPDSGWSSEKLSRLPGVLSLLYLMFNEGYSVTHSKQGLTRPLCKEAIRLCRLLLSSFPQEADINGLLALFLFQYSRSEARVDEQGQLLTLEQQDRSIWDHTLIQQGLIYLSKSQRLGPEGTAFQLQAALAAEHCVSPSAEQTNWVNILRHYDALFLLQPSPIVKLNRAVAVFKVLGTKEALRELSELQTRLAHFLHYHTTLGGILFEDGQWEKSAQAYRQALLLGPGEQEKQHIEGQLQKITLEITPPK